jgi:hypothetical protein
MARTYKRDANGRFASGGGSSGGGRKGGGGGRQTPKTPASKAKKAFKAKRHDPAKAAAGKARKPMAGDGLFNELFRGKATRKSRGAKPTTEAGRGRYLKMQEAKRSAAKEMQRQTSRSRGGTWLKN